MHARSSAAKHGGTPECYIKIHEFLDCTKALLPDCRHRAILHSSFGTYLAELVLGRTITNSDGKEISVREIAEEHILEDLGRIPTVQDWLSGLPIEDWMLSQTVRQKKPIIEAKPREPEPKEEPVFDPSDWISDPYNPNYPSPYYPNNPYIGKDLPYPTIVD